MLKKQIPLTAKKPAPANAGGAASEVEKLKAALNLAQEKERAAVQREQMAVEKERRALADYQNLVRRGVEERMRIAKFAALDFVEAILEPLGHLSLAAEQLNDPGLNMVVNQLWGRLNEAGLEEINPMGQKFDVATMEAVHAEESQLGDSAGVVKKVVSKGYKLNGEVIRHAKVVVG